MEAGKNERGIMPIPGLQYLYPNSHTKFTQRVLLVAGPTGSGKTHYCIEFAREGLESGDYCIYVNCGQAVSEDRFAKSPAKVSSATNKHLVIVSPSFSTSSAKETALQSLMQEILKLLSREEQVVSGRATSIRLVIDSLTQLIARFTLEQVQKFVVELYDFLQSRGNVMALLAIAGRPSDSAVDLLGSLLDGVIQLRVEEREEGSEMSREIRILALRSATLVPKWVPFQIDNGSMRFGIDVSNKSSAQLRCKLCHEPIVGEVAGSEADSPFHPSCFITHKKLGEVYGLNVGYGLEPGVVNANFFFIDIVGLSDPSLSVQKQINKIQELNLRIKSCEAFKAITRTDKIVLPTGDGMAIGFLINPELPLQLSIQLHHKLAEFNAKVPPDEALGVRIGLSSGPVFVVSDINNNQNVWGPGIILARRVMDLGDSGHILLADNIAETLRNLKDEYRTSIRLLGSEYRIKHGQSLKLYTAYSQDFGNPVVPSKVAMYL